MLNVTSYREIKITMRYHLEKITSFGEDMEESEPLGIIDGNVTDTATVETSLGVPQHTKHRITI